MKKIVPLYEFSNLIRNLLTIYSGLKGDFSKEVVIPVT